MKKDAYYFPHFANSRNDSKIVKLRRVLGIEGYGLYFMLLEVLREQTDFKYPVSGVEDLAYEWHTSKEKIISVIADYGLFTVQPDFFFSVKQIAFLQPYIEKSNRARMAARKRWDDANAHANALEMQCDSKTNAMQVKESKVKESKVKEEESGTNAFTPPNENLKLSSLENKANDTEKKKEKKVPRKKESHNSETIALFDNLRGYFKKADYSPADELKTLDALEKLCRLDGFDTVVVANTVKAAHNMNLWYFENCQTIQGLRSKKDGMTKFEKLKLYLDAEKEKSNSKRDPNYHRANPNPVKADKTPSNIIVW